MNNSRKFISSSKATLILEFQRRVAKAAYEILHKTKQLTLKFPQTINAFRLLEMHEYYFKGKMPAKLLKCNAVN